ncbi:hypothetical protein ABK249_23010 [Neorhizobium sp. Rsf11]|uniref:Uncharacterized protein n=1 Tax=Neorhizobium phenanthreniclasticum TaxID=3157917 RepID=A0ABV0M9N8_9HYPH
MTRQKKMQAAMLAEYKGRRVTVICEECEILRSFDGTALFEEHGDVSMPGLLGDLAKAVGCDRSKSGFYNRCTLHYYFTHDEWADRTGLVSREEFEIAVGKRLADLQEWEVLTARCRCGRYGTLNRKALERRCGREARLKDLAGRLRCKECKRCDSVIEISSLPR